VHVSLLIWAITLVGLIAVLVADLLIIGRRPHEPSMREAAAWVSVYVGLAVAFGLVLLATYGPTYSGEFFAGWLTEYSLSVDNLFVFVIIMSAFAVPRIHQQRVLLVGIVLALALRGVFIFAGAALINQFVWVFYLFGAFLLATAIRLAKSHGDTDAEYRENGLVRWSRRILPISDEYDGARLTTHRPRDEARRGSGARRWMFTPMLIVMIAIGTTDLVFALDSIPAIFGLTKEAYIVFTANVFALMGLRQLYFLLGGLLDRLVYLSYGLAAVLGFIGVKLILEALHGNDLPFINGGQPVEWAPHIPIWLSLTVIVVALGVATIASLIKSRGGPPDRRATPRDDRGTPQGAATTSGRPRSGEQSQAAAAADRG
jgi:tellurite resistance protein TerC